MQMMPSVAMGQGYQIWEQGYTRNSSSQLEELMGSLDPGRLNTVLSSLNYTERSQGTRFDMLISHRYPVSLGLLVVKGWSIGYV